MMIRTLGSSIVVAIGIAVALSLLPSVDMLSDGEVSVFHPENPTALSEERLVDFLASQQSRFAYRHAEWDAQTLTLSVDFTASGQPAKKRIAEDWNRFIRDVFQSTSNVETLECRLFAGEGTVLAELKVNRDNLETKISEQGTTLEYMERNFDFRVR